MKYFSIITIFILLNLSLCFAITCEEVKTLLDVEYEGNCCDLQQVNCDEANEKILSIESLLDEDVYENNKNLYRRKGGGHGGHGGGHGHSKSRVRGGSSSSHSGGASIKPNSFIWALAILFLVKLI